MEKIKKLLAMAFGTYQVFRGAPIDGEVRGWIWRETFYFDERNTRSMG